MKEVLDAAFLTAKYIIMYGLCGWATLILCWRLCPGDYWLNYNKVVDEELQEVIEPEYVAIGFTVGLWPIAIPVILSRYLFDNTSSVRKGLAKATLIAAGQKAHVVDEKPSTKRSLPIPHKYVGTN